jgi:UbiD family decarboxylase
MAKDLSHFLDEIEGDHPDLFLRITEEVNPSHFEITALLSLLEKKGHEKMVLFEKALSIDGKARIPLLFNAFSSRSLCALALDLPRADQYMGLVEEFAKRENFQGHIELVAESEAPCKEAAWEGEAVSLLRLPVPMHHQKDVGPYLTMTCIMKGLGQDFYDITFTKNMVKGPKRMSVSAHPHHHLEAILAEYEKKKMKAPVIVVMGHHPAFYLSSCCITPFGNNDYLTASSFLKEPLRLTPSRTWGKDFLVPADAEIIIEAEITPGLRETQNPFGEIAGYYQGEMSMPVAEVTTITMKKKPVMQGVFPGHPEHWNLGGIPKEGSVYSVIKRNLPGLKAIHLPPSGCGRFSCYISLKQEFENEPRKAAMAAFTEMPNLKLAVIVDEDVDVYNEQEIQWAVVTRTHWDKDLEVIRKIQTFRQWLGDAVAIIDATRPKGINFPEKNEIPREALSRVEKKYNL